MDGDHQDHAPFNWQQGSWAGGDLYLDEEGLIIEDCPAGGCAISTQFSSGQFNHYRDVSLRLQARIIAGTGSIVPWGRWANQWSYYGSVRPFSDKVIVGVAQGQDGTELADVSVDLDEDQDIVLKFDMIGDDGAKLPMGSETTSGDAPRFKVRAVGSLERMVLPSARRSSELRPA